MTAKERRTVTIDAALLAAVDAAVELGHAASVSAWINEAIAKQLRHEQLLRAGREAVAAYEREFGAFTKEELEEQRRTDRANAIRVNAPRRPAGTKGRTRRAG
jgi:Arc/MetJ-type ribon-helix-helix transcriptional regulator